MNVKEIRQPLVSCIIPAYNAAHTLVRAVESVRQQTYPNIQIVVVNDGSEDNTEDVVLSRLPGVTYVKHVHNKGPSAARNSGARAARGAVLAFLDADDEWLPVKTEIQLDALGRLPNAGVLFTGMLILTERRGKKVLPVRPRAGLSHFTARDILQGRWAGLGASAMMYASTFWAFGGFEESRPLLEAELWARMAARGSAVARLELPLYVQHASARSLSRDVRWNFDAVMHMVESWAPDSPEGRSIGMSRQEYARLRARWLTTLTLRLMGAGQFHEARRRLSREAAAPNQQRRLSVLKFLVARCPTLVRTVVGAAWLPGRLLRYLPAWATYRRYAPVLATCATDATRFQQVFSRDGAGGLPLHSSGPQRRTAANSEEQRKGVRQGSGDGLEDDAAQELGSTSGMMHTRFGRQGRGSRRPDRAEPVQDQPMAPIAPEEHAESLES